MGGDKRVTLTQNPTREINIGNINPGAGTHEPNHGPVKHSGPKFGFGSSTRDAFKPKATPGPGYY